MSTNENNVAIAKAEQSNQLKNRYLDILLSTLENKLIDYQISGKTIQVRELDAAVLGAEALFRQEEANFSKITSSELAENYSMENYFTHGKFKENIVIHRGSSSLNQHLDPSISDYDKTVIYSLQHVSVAMLQGQLVQEESAKMDALTKAGSAPLSQAELDRNVLLINEAARQIDKKVFDQLKNVSSLQDFRNRVRAMRGIDWTKTENSHLKKVLGDIPNLTITNGPSQFNTDTTRSLTLNHGKNFRDEVNTTLDTVEQMKDFDKQEQMKDPKQRSMKKSALTILQEELQLPLDGAEAVLNNHSQHVYSYSQTILRELRGALEPLGIAVDFDTIEWDMSNNQTETTQTVKLKDLTFRNSAKREDILRIDGEVIVEATFNTVNNQWSVSPIRHSGGNAKFFSDLILKNSIDVFQYPELSQLLPYRTRNNLDFLDFYADAPHSALESLTHTIPAQAESIKTFIQGLQNKLAAENVNMRQFANNISTNQHQFFQSYPGIRDYIEKNAQVLEKLESNKMGDSSLTSLYEARQKNINSGNYKNPDKIVALSQKLFTKKELLDLILKDQVFLTSGDKNHFALWREVYPQPQLDDAQIERVIKNYNEIKNQTNILNDYPELNDALLQNLRYLEVNQGDPVGAMALLHHAEQFFTTLPEKVLLQKHLGGTELEYRNPRQEMIDAYKTKIVDQYRAMKEAALIDEHSLWHQEINDPDINQSEPVLQKTLDKVNIPADYHLPESVVIQQEETNKRMKTTLKGIYQPEPVSSLQQDSINQIYFMVCSAILPQNPKLALLDAEAGLKFFCSGNCNEEKLNAFKAEIHDIHEQQGELKGGIAGIFNSIWNWIKSWFVDDNQLSHSQSAADKLIKEVNKLTLTSPQAGGGCSDYSTKVKESLQAIKNTPELPPGYAQLEEDDDDYESYAGPN